MKKSKVSGKVNLGCLFLIIVLIAGGYVGYKFGRVYLAKYIFNKKLYEIAGNVAADYNSKAFPYNRTIIEEVLKEAKQLSMDISHDDIWVTRSAGLASIKVTWEVDVVLPQYTRHFVFEFEIHRKVSF
jgi:hypothetical protein